MGLVKINTDFKNIGHQEFLRPNFGYRYFFDIQKGIIFNAPQLIQLKYVLTELKTNKIYKGDLLKSELLIDIGNIDKRNNILTNIQKVNSIGSNKNIIKNGDIIIPKLQPRMGNIFLNLSHQRYIGSTELIEYTISVNHNPVFIYYLITSSVFLKNLIKLESGKTHRRVNSIDLLKIKPIEKEIHTLKNQIKDLKEVIDKEFADVFNFDLTKADKAKNEIIHIANFTDIANDEMKFDISLKYRYIFNKFIKRFEKTEWIVLDKIVTVKGGKRLPKGQDVTENETDYKYIRVDDLDWDGDFDIDNVKYISEENQKKIKNYTANENDILLTIVGATVGKCGLMPKDLDGYNITENFARLIIKNKKEYLPEYLLFCLMSKTSIFQIDEYIGRGSQGKLAIFRIKKIKIPVLDINEQKKLIKSIKNEFDAQNLITKKIIKERKKIDVLIDETIKNAP
ncbi:hypothetical protein HN836_02365 [Candidatus Woesearchaeota archaeon]|nr:hypothetical protein [Candidatus Woesearchaeota archaeon]